MKYVFLIVLMSLMVFVGCDIPVGVFAPIEEEDQTGTTEEEPVTEEPVTEEPVTEEPEEYVVFDETMTSYSETEFTEVDGIISYSGDYSTPAMIENSNFYIDFRNGDTFTVSVDFLFDMSQSDLNSLKGEKVKFWINFGDISLHYKALVPADDGNKYIGIDDNKFIDYWTNVNIWYNLTMVVSESEIIVSLDGTEIFRSDNTSEFFDNFSIEYIARTNGSRTPSMSFRNITIH